MGCIPILCDCDCDPKKAQSHIAPCERAFSHSFLWTLVATTLYCPNLDEWSLYLNIFGTTEFLDSININENTSIVHRFPLENYKLLRKCFVIYYHSSQRVGNIAIELIA